jgi:hypothetical protein
MDSQLPGLYPTKEVPCSGSPGKVSYAKILSMPFSRSRIDLVLLLVSLFCPHMVNQPAFAQETEQETGTASLSQLRDERISWLTTYLLHDDSGNFIYGLEAGDVSIVENGDQAPVKDLRHAQAGCPVCYRISSGRSLSVRIRGDNSLYLPNRSD